MKSSPISLPSKKLAKVALPISRVRTEGLGMVAKPTKLLPLESGLRLTVASVTSRPLKELRPGGLLV